MLVKVGVARSLAERTGTLVPRELVDDDTGRGKKGEGCPDGHRASENYRITSNKTPATSGVRALSAFSTRLFSNTDLLSLG